MQRFTISQSVSRIVSRRLFLALALLLSLTAFLPSQRAYAQASIYAALINVNSGKCLEANGTHQQGQAMVQVTCNGSNGFILTPQADGSYEIASVSLNPLVLDIEGGSQNNGARVILWGPHGGANQRFRLEQQSDGSYVIRAVHSGQVLDVSGGSRSDGAAVIQWPLHGGPNQRWFITPIGGGVN